MVVAAVVGYLIGSFPPAVLVGRFFRVDLRQRGDRNPGWWNVRGVLGTKAALVVLVADLLKGALAAAVAASLWGPWWVAYVGLGFAMIGHAFPVFADFRGGRSVPTFIGGVLVLVPGPALVAAALGAAVGFAFRRVLYGARVGVLVFPLVEAFFRPRAEVAVSLLLMAFIALRFLLAGLPAPSTLPAGVEGDAPPVSSS